MNYYNENDKRTAAWLRELIKEKLISDGEVDERSITEVKGSDVKGFAQCHFFAGIGGWSYALRLAEWSDDKPVWTGSCPCQPFSQAGKGQVDKDERHLWPSFRELISECGPSVTFGEQVCSPDGRIWLAGVRTDLEALGYVLGAVDTCAAGISAPHNRPRLYWMAHSERDGRREGSASKPRQESGNAQSLNRSAALRMAESDNNGRNRTLATSPVAGGDQPKKWLLERDSNAVGMGESIVAGLEGHTRNGNDWNQPGRINTSPAGPTSTTGAWSDYEIVQCRDGKARRVKSGLFPLAPRLPGDVALLWGAGNAIVPQLAAEFVKAAIEALE